MRLKNYANLFGVVLDNYKNSIGKGSLKKGSGIYCAAT
jgi:hypothetical protein